MRWLGALLLLASLAIAQAASPVIAQLLRELSREQVQALGPRPTVRTAASVIPSDRRDAVASSLKQLEAGASFQTLVELTHAYLYLAHPEEADRVSRLAQAANPGVEGLAFRAWVAQQTGDIDGAAEAAREALKLAPARPDLVAILKLTEGRTRKERGSNGHPTSATAPAFKKDSPVFHGNARRREAERLLAEAVRAKNVGDNDRATALARRAAEADPDSTELKEFLAAQNVPARSDISAAALNLLRTTATGREISEFIEARKIPVRLASSLPGSAAAYYDFASKTIFVGPGFASELPVSQAMLIGHEGYHAIQDMRYSLAPVLETEQDAWLRTMVVYDELRSAGHPALPPIHDWNRYELPFRMAVAVRDPAPFYDFIRDSYETEAGTRQAAELAAIPRLARGPVGLLLRMVYSPAYMNAVSARDLRWSISGNLVNGRQKLLNTSVQHEQERKWFATWLNRQISH